MPGSVADNGGTRVATASQIPEELNGLIFYLLLFLTPQWKRRVPTSWTVFPNAASVAVQ